MEVVSQNIGGNLLDEAVSIVEGKDLPDWSGIAGQLDRRLKMLDEQIEKVPVVPVQLQDEYRQEIDTLSLENMQLNSKLEQTRSALERAKKAYKEESANSNHLSTRLQDLESRLLKVLNRDF